MADLRRYVLRLVDHAGAHRAGVDLDKTDNVRLFSAYELSDARQDFTVAAQVPRTRQRQVKSRPGAGCIADVVKKQAQLRAVEGSSGGNGVFYRVCGAGAPP